MEELAESLHPGGLALTVTLYLEGNKLLVFLEYEVHLVIAVAPVIHLETMHESLAYDVSSDCRFEDLSPLLAVGNGFLECQATLHTQQGIVEDLVLRNAGTLASHVHGEFLKSSDQAAVAQEIEVSSQCNRVARILQSA